MTLIASLLIALATIQTPTPTPAPQTPSAPPGQTAPMQAPARYVLGPKDQLKITVFGEEGLENQTYTIDSDGSITFPLIGRIVAGGMTVGEFQEQLRARLADGYIKKPQVGVDIVGYKSQFVLVGGEVRTPGMIPMAGVMTLPEALAIAGSPKETASNEVIITHHKPGGDASDINDSVHVNLKDLQVGTAGQDVFLQDGDTVFVPKAQRFYIQGQVKTGGSFILDPGMTVQQALALAGGLSERGSDRRITASRTVKGKVVEVHLKLTDKVLADDVITVGGRIF